MRFVPAYVPSYRQPMAARMDAASPASCDACAAVSFLPDCALTWLMKDARSLQAAAVSPAASAPCAWLSLTSRLLAVPWCRLKLFTRSIRLPTRPDGVG